ncbi:GGDEF domain-containing protein [Pistricoccus aurantiacus]|uniref:GGDEF domain-containing protein n=1 Tax=Pistricoccus aurantiacus TaxID=1883414 RepID=UPI003636C5E1
MDHSSRTNIATDTDEKRYFQPLPRLEVLLSLADYKAHLPRAEHRQQSRLNAVFLLCSIWGILSYIPFDYLMVPDHWMALSIGRLMLALLLLGCLLWQHRRPRRTERALLVGALGAEIFFGWGASLIETPLAFLSWNLSVAVAVFVLLPLATVWRWANMLAHNLFMVAVYGVFFLESPFSSSELVQYGGAFLLVGLTISPFLSHVRYVNFTQSARLRQKLIQRNRELVAANEQLVQKGKVLTHLANHDVMTNLPNRRCGMVFLQEAMTASLQEKHPLSLLLIDVDNLKGVNDTLGHHYGDRMICHVASLLVELLDEHHLACRTGGDEFLVVMPNTDAQTCDRWCLRLTEQLASDESRENLGFAVSASVGTTTFEPSRETLFDVDTLIQRADAKMYHHKRRARQRRTTRPTKLVYSQDSDIDKVV